MLTQYVYTSKATASNFAESIFSTRDTDIPIHAYIYHFYLENTYSS